MTALANKTEAARGLVERCLERSRRPVIASSFGKDSMVLLSIVESVAGKLPIVFHREPFFPEKYAFANKVIADRGYTVYDYAPSVTAVMKSRGHVEIINAYQVGPGRFTELPTGVAEPVEGRPYLCGYEDLYSKPVGSFVFPWDTVFVGHKSSDVDPLRGPIPLNADVSAVEGAPSYVFPLRHFTDEDVWRYTEENGLPVHTERYDPESGYHERPDTAANPDYHYACTRCMDPDRPTVVECPRLGAEITNRSPHLRFADPSKVPAYVQGGAP